MTDTWNRAEFELQLARTLLEQAEYDLSTQQARVDIYKGRVEFWKGKVADARPEENRSTPG